MRAAPAVQVTLAPDRAWSVFVRAVGAAALAGLAASAGMRAGWPAPAAAACAMLGALVGAWAAGRWLAPPYVGTLSWDGKTWAWQGAGESAPQPVAEVRVVIDLGPWMLLRLRSPARWLPLAEHRAGAAWHALRAAVARPEAVE